jgi:hypothetical protein
MRPEAARQGAETKFAGSERAMKIAMLISGMAVNRLIAGLLAMLLAFPLSAMSASAQEQNNAPAQPQQPAPQDTQGAAGQNGAPAAVGTAAAPAETNAGIAASRPAGAAIAPARQRRRHALLIKVGVVVGAAVALGVVVALSHGSPSVPPR